MKNTVLLMFSLFLGMATFAQGDFHKLSVGVGFGATIGFADLKEKGQSLGGYGEFTYYLTPFILTSLEAQVGKVKGGDVTTDPHSRAFSNDYKALSINVKAGLGQFIDYSVNDVARFFKGVYLGVGLGAINNNLGYVVRYKPNTQLAYPPNGYQFPGKDQSTNLLLPINLGINFSFPNYYGEARYVLNFNYQANYTFGEGLDGYNDPIDLFSNSAPDIYVLFSIGLKYNFGPTRLSRRVF